MSAERHQAATPVAVDDPDTLLHLIGELHSQRAERIQEQRRADQRQGHADNTSAQRGAIVQDLADCTRSGAPRQSTLLWHLTSQAEATRSEGSHGPDARQVVQSAEVAAARQVDGQWDESLAVYRDAGWDGEPGEHERMFWRDGFNRGVQVAAATWAANR